MPVPGRSACPIYLWFHVSALKAAFVSSFSGITHFITYISAACAFITRDQPLSSPRQLSAQARSHSQIQGTSTTYLSSAGGRSRLPFEDVLKLNSKSQQFPTTLRLLPLGGAMGYGRRTLMQYAVAVLLVTGIMVTGMLDLAQATCNCLALTLMESHRFKQKSVGGVPLGAPRYS